MADKNSILNVLKKHLKETLTSWNEDQFDEHRSMSEMGIDSLDSVQVLFYSMKELKIKSLQMDLLHKQTIKEIVDTLDSTNAGKP